jgi:TonB family protein
MNLVRGLSLSVLVHGLIYFSGLGYVNWQKAQAGSIMDIDLGRSSLLLRPRQAAAIRGGVIPVEPWVLARPVARTLRKVTASLPETSVEPAAGTAAPGEGSGGSGAAPGWVPAALAAHRPEWLEGFITEEDYPPAARKQGKQGRVVASVVIDPTGAVLEVQLTEESYPEFNQLVEARLRKARFRPGRDQNDRPIAVRMSIPIVFELR